MTLALPWMISLTLSRSALTLFLDYHQARWCWTNDAHRQASFRDDGELIKAIAEAGGRDEKSTVLGDCQSHRKVIIETITHEDRQL
ncbi:hypothetical protein BC360_27870 [Ensifer sp. LC163]|nr:hypothetical protein BC360_27870 [Ensifer sp. LC163]